MVDVAIKQEDVDCVEKGKCVRFPDDLASCAKCQNNRGRKDYFKPMEKPTMPSTFDMGPPNVGPLGPMWVPQPDPDSTIRPTRWRKDEFVCDTRSG